MSSVSINAPKTPVTKGSNGIAAATIPNICKMPGPPSPFVPTPLPNIGKSSLSPQNYSTTVTVEGEAVAVRGASFGSIGDIASQGTGGGLISSNAEGITKFIAPGSLDVQIEGKNVHLLGDAMLNNCALAGSPSNAATMSGVLQAPLMTMASELHAVEAAEAPDHVIEIVLTDENDEPRANERVTLFLEDGSSRAFRLNGDGYIRIDGMTSATCRVYFPDSRDSDVSPVP